MELRLLGPLEVVDGGSPLSVPAGKQRAVLALLALHANRTVTSDRLLDDLWGERAPDSARKMVQIHVSKLRKSLPGLRLHTRPSGYMLELDDEELDLARFESMTSEGRAALAEGRTREAAEVLRRALSLWRGLALAELSEPFAAHEQARLDELRLAMLELRLDADLALGRHAEVAGELEAEIARHPLRERFREQYMLALYRSGRQAEALASYQAFRRTLADSLGIEPSRSLKDLERRILRQEEDLGDSAPPSPAPAPRHGPPGIRAAEPDIRYARSGDVRIAYQLVGKGAIDLMLVNGWVCTFQPAWENPKLARFYRRLASLGRLVLFDKRGTGLSDRVSPDNVPDLETRMDDLRAVMDAIGSERAVVLGVSEGGSMSTLFAATHPERTLALALMGTFARMMWAPDYPSGVTEDEYERRLIALEDEDWAQRATREWLGRVAPNLLADEAAFEWYCSYVERGASPGANRTLRLMNAEIDIRHVLPTIGIPTLVLFRADEHFADGARYMGAQIPGARVVELPGNDHLPWEGDQEALTDEIERFLAGVHAETTPDRVLATLLFTDIVGSTEKAAALGDRAWHELLQQHHRVVRAQLARFRGREVDTAGDGVLATFDGPARAVRCAKAITDALRPLGLEVRAGVHTGEIQVVERDVRGIAVHIGARVMSESKPGEVLVSSTVKDIVAGSGIAFEERGETVLKGVPGSWRLYAALSE